MSKTTVLLKTHRYEFSEYAMTQLNYFTQVHKYDERKAFKEAWEKWITTDDISQMIASETQKLTDEGFAGDVEDKMFKAVRYYFRKKPAAQTTEKEQPPRKKYVGFTGKILTAMDSHIIFKIKENLQEQHQQNNLEKLDKKYFKSNVSPDKAFNDFYSTNTEIIQEETELLMSEETMNDEDIELKIKKTYKNRYQTIRKKLQT
jgi:hypothetical protein